MSNDNVVRIGGLARSIGRIGSLQFVIESVIDPYYNFEEGLAECTIRNRWSLGVDHNGNHFFYGGMTLDDLLGIYKENMKPKEQESIELALDLATVVLAVQKPEGLRMYAGCSLNEVLKLYADEVGDV